MPAASRGHNNGVFGGDEAAAFLAGLWTTESLDRVVDAGIVTLAAGILGWQGYKRPRTTGAVAAVWLLWFVCRIAEGQSAWEHFVQNTSDARGATEDAVRAAGSMLLAWAVLFLPIAEDAERILSPVVREAGRGLAALWNLFTWQQRGLLALCALALGGTAVASASAVAAVQRHKSAVGAVLFQLSFAVCGPLLWWLTAHLPFECSSILVGVAVSLLPMLLSVRALLSLEEEREHQGEGYEPLPKTVFFLPPDTVEEPTSDKDFPSEDLQKRLCAWLSYWSCWPFFHLACMMRSTELVPDETKPAVDGLLIALAAWAQVWQASRIAPCLYTACAGCFSHLSERALEAGSAASNSAAGFATWLWQAGGASFFGGQGSRWAFVVAVAAAVLVLASLVLQAMALANALLTLGLLVAMAVDSARCAASGHSEALPPRLAFWVVSTSWLWLCSLPLGIGSLLAAWTPLVLALAAAVGEFLLKAVLRLLRAGAAALLAWRRDDQGGESREASYAGEGDAPDWGVDENGAEGSQGKEATPSVRSSPDSAALATEAPTEAPASTRPSRV